MPSYKKEGIKTKRIGVVLPEELGSLLEQVAKNKAWSVSQTAAFAIQQWLEQYGTSATPSSVEKEDVA
jgi:metal-responsive CopG/Arc/MetJ family transcriptional regulator